MCYCGVSSSNVENKERKEVQKGVTRWIIPVGYRAISNKLMYKCILSKKLHRVHTNMSLMIPTQRNTNADMHTHVHTYEFSGAYVCTHTCTMHTLASSVLSFTC